MRSSFERPFRHGMLYVNIGNHPIYILVHTSCNAQIEKRLLCSYHLPDIYDCVLYVYRNPR